MICNLFQVAPSGRGYHFFPGVNPEYYLYPLIPNAQNYFIMLPLRTCVRVIPQKRMFFVQEHLSRYLF